MDKEIFSSKDSTYSRKKFNESNKIANILNEKNQSDTILTESTYIQAEQEKEDAFSLANINNKKRREERIELANRKKFIQENYGQLVIFFFENLIYESLLIEDKLKKENKDYLNEKTKKFIEGLAESGVFSEDLESVTMKKILESIGTHVDYMYDVKDDKEKVKLVRESFLKDVSTYTSFVSSCIKEKVASVVKEEKKFSKSLNESEKEFKGKDSLFRVLQLENTKLSMKEEKTTEMNDVVMAQAFAETLVDYTLLETVNTLRLINLDSNQLRNGTERFFKQ